MIAFCFLDLDPFWRVLQGIHEQVVGRHHKGWVSLASGHPAYLQGYVLRGDADRRPIGTLEHLLNYVSVLQRDRAHPFPL